jgi:SAM-dependent methyltransferase
MDVNIVNSKKKSFADFREFIELLLVKIKVSLKNFFEWARVILRYYPSWRFAKIDLGIVLSYLFNSPYLISKKFLLERKEQDVYAYGETPLTTMDKIAKECRLGKNDNVFEIGCGRGRTCFWLNAFIGCKVVGIEYIPEFVATANAVKERFNVEDVEFRLQDMLEADYFQATVVYLYGTNLDDHVINRLVEKLAKTKPGTKVITISYPLTNYTASDKFEVMRCFPARFPWGEADVYLQMRK